jgi:polysaccharide export outer membrane protein
MKRTLTMSGLVIAGLVVLAGLTKAGQGQKTKADKSQPEAAAADASYVIGPEDVLEIDVWKEKEISSTVPVRPDGKISLPLLNDVRAAGLTPMQLQTGIRDGLKKFISDPQVTVIVTQVNSRKIFVLGEVARPGTFPMLPNMTVLQALSTAGGFTQFAKEKGVYVLRTENGHQITLPFNYKEVVRGKSPAQNIELKPGDTIVVP